MAIDFGSENVTLTIVERTWRIEIDTPIGDDPRLRIWREKVWLRDDGSTAQVDRNIPLIERQFSEIVDRTVGGLSGSALATALSAWADDLRHEDIKREEEAEVARKAAEEERAAYAAQQAENDRLREEMKENMRADDRARFAALRAEEDQQAEKAKQAAVADSTTAVKM